MSPQGTALTPALRPRGRRPTRSVANVLWPDPHRVTRAPCTPAPGSVSARSRGRLLGLVLFPFGGGSDVGDPAGSHCADASSPTPTPSGQRRRRLGSLGTALGQPSLLRQTSRSGDSAAGKEPSEAFCASPRSPQVLETGPARLGPPRPTGLGWGGVADAAWALPQSRVGNAAAEISELRWD